MSVESLNAWRELRPCPSTKHAVGGVRTMLGVFRCELRDGHIGHHTSETFRLVSHPRGWS